MRSPDCLFLSKLASSIRFSEAVLYAEGNGNFETTLFLHKTLFYYFIFNIFFEIYCWKYFSFKFFFSFILVFVSIERYMLTVRSAYLNFARRNRSFLCILAIVGALLMKAPIALELELKLEKQCIGTVSEYVVDLSNRCASLWYGTIYRFWIRNIVTVFTPFILIIHINLRIVSAIKSQVYLERICSMQKASKHKVRFSSTP